VAKAKTGYCSICGRYDSVEDVDVGDALYICCPYCAELDGPGLSRFSSEVSLGDIALLLVQLGSQILSRLDEISKKLSVVEESGTSPHKEATARNERS